MTATTTTIAGWYGVSTVELTARMVVALTIITVILTVVTRYTKRYLSRSEPNQIIIRHNHQLTKQTHLTLLTAGQRHLLIATNNNTTTLLAEGEDLTTPPTTSPNPETGIDPTIDIRPKPNPLKTLQNKTVRRA